MKWMTVLALLLVPTFALAAEIVTKKPVRGKAPSFNAPCVVRVSFTSTAAGIDRKLAEGLTAHLRKSAAIDRVTIQPWGREGELTYCLESRRGTQAAYYVVQTYFRRAGAPKRGQLKIERAGRGGSN